MSRRNEVEIALSLQDRASRPLQQAGNNFRRFERTIRDNLFVIGAIGGAVTGAVLGLKSLADAAREGQVAQAQLARVVENTGASWSDMEDQVQSTILSLERATAVGDAEISRALTRLTSVVGDADLALQALPTILDAAAVSGSNVETVAGTLGRALGGAANTAESLGITFDASADFADRLAQAQEVAAGAAAASVTEMDRLGTTLDNLQETIGALVLPSLEEGAGLLDDFTRAAMRATRELRDLSGGQGLEGMETQLGIGVASEELSTPLSRLRALLRGYADEDIPAAVDATNEGSAAVANFAALEEKRAKDLENSQKILAQSQVSQEQYNQSIRDSIAVYGEQAEAAQAAFEAQQMQEEITQKILDLEFNQWLEDVDAGLALLVNDIKVLNPLAFETNELVETANRILRQYRQGLINAADAEDLLQGALQAVRGEIDRQNEALQRQIALAEERIRQQEKLTGRQLLQPGGFTGTQEQLETAFGGFIQNAINRGGTAVDGGVEIGGRVITLDNFVDLVEQLAREGTKGGVSPIIDALRRLRDLAGFDQGGVVPGPRGSAQLVMAHGGETILPTHKSGGMGNVVVNINVAGSIIGERDFMSRAKREIVATLRGGGFRGVIERR